MEITGSRGGESREGREKPDTYLGSTEKGPVAPGAAGLAEISPHHFARELLGDHQLECANVARVGCDLPELHSYSPLAPAQTLENVSTPDTIREEV